MMTQALDYRPRAYRAVTPGIAASGTAGLLAFLKRAFGAEEHFAVRTPDGNLGHGQILIGDSIVELSEARREWPARRSTLHLYVPDADAWYRRAIEAGAESLTEPADAPYGDRAAAVRDPAGNRWFLATRLEGEPVPEGFHTVTPYLVISRADAVIALAVEAFGAVEHLRVPRPDGSIMHALIQVHDSMIEMADGQAPWEPHPAGLHLYVPDADAAYQRAVLAGATPLYPMTDMFYGDREGGVQDAGGNHWYIGTHREDVPVDELERRAGAQRRG